jgi:serpin B
VLGEKGMRVAGSRWFGIFLFSCLMLGLLGCVDGVSSNWLSDRAVAQSQDRSARSPEVLYPSPEEISDMAQSSVSPSPAPGQNPGQIPGQASSQNTVDARLVAANTRFGFKLFSQLFEQGQTQNVMVSPTSVAIALSMAYNGASGSTQQAMAEALEFQGMSLAEINQANGALENSLEAADPSVKLAIANSLWGNQGFAFKADFLQRNQEFYQAEVTNLDFKSPDAADRINAWVNDNTQGKIPEIVKEIDPQQVMFLINAVYFKGTWTKPFDPQRTSDRPFTLLDGSQKQHPLMSQQGSYQYYENDQFQAVNLPYGNGRLSFYVFLPRANSSLKSFAQTLTADHWDTWMGRFASRPGSIQLPRFKFSYGTSLNDALQAIGMAPVFDAGQADFSGLSEEPTLINEVQHKTFIEVNEEGTEAAAATSVGIARMSAPTAPPFQMVVDRPFFTAIRDNQTGAVLFMGTVVEPE